MLDTWFFCFHCSLGQGNQCVMTYKVLAYKVTRQGHVWPILSRALDMLDTCFFPWFVGSRKTKACRPDTWYVTLTRDLVRQGHVILQVIYVISGPVHISISIKRIVCLSVSVSVSVSVCLDAFAQFSSYEVQTSQDRQWLLGIGRGGVDDSTVPPEGSEIKG